MPIFPLLWKNQAGLHWRLCLLGLGLLVIISSCYSTRRPVRPPKRNDGTGNSDSHKGLSHSKSPKDKSSVVPYPGAGQSHLSPEPNPEELQKNWHKILGGKDHLKGDLKLEGTWNITYNETELASPVIMLIRPQHFVYISIRPALGIEMLRIILRPDSVWMISRLNKNYWSGTWAELEPSLGMPLDYLWFQDALLHGHRSLIGMAIHNKLRPPEYPIQSIRFETKPNQNIAKLEAEWGRWPSKIHALQVQSPAGNLKMEYSKIFESESSTLPARMTFALTIPRNNALLEMHWKEPKFQGVEMPSIKIPGDYQKLKLGR